MFPHDRFNSLAIDSVKYIWTTMGLPIASLEKLQLPGQGLGLPSSFKIGHMAQASIGLSSLLTTQFYALRTASSVRTVKVPLEHAAIEFKSERLYTLAGEPAPSPWGPIGGLHKTSDGYVRVHDSFPNHRLGALALVGCKTNATWVELGMNIKNWCPVDLEAAAFQNRLGISALRSYSQWVVLPQA